MPLLIAHLVLYTPQLPSEIKVHITLDAMGSNPFSVLRVLGLAHQNAKWHPFVHAHRTRLTHAPGVVRVAAVICALVAVRTAVPNSLEHAANP